jgi:hypothetical protein
MVITLFLISQSLNLFQFILLSSCRWFYRIKICKYSQIHIISSFISDNHQNSSCLYSVGWWLCAGTAEYDMCRNQNDITFLAFFFCFLVYFLLREDCVAESVLCICKKYKLRLVTMLIFFFYIPYFLIVFILLMAWICVLFVYLSHARCYIFLFCSSFLQYTTINYSKVKENTRNKYFKFFWKEGDHCSYAIFFLTVS